MGNTCGLPKIDNVMKNLTLNEGQIARYLYFAKYLVDFFTFFQIPMYRGHEMHGVLYTVVSSDF